jgi:hypothetical protein
MEQVKTNYSVTSFNLHGFNQGAIFLNSLCEVSKIDLICIQEHWLTPDLMHFIHNFNSGYITFGISAMESVVHSGILRGRPRGGVATLVKACLLNVQCRGRQEFGFGFAFGAESEHMASFGLVSVSAEAKKLAFGLLSVSAETDIDFRSSTEDLFFYSHAV